MTGRALPHAPLPWRDVHAVLFDLDGTLIDSAPDLGAAADRMRLDRGLPSLPLAVYRPMAGAGARGLDVVCRRRFGFDEVAETAERPVGGDSCADRPEHLVEHMFTRL